MLIAKSAMTYHIQTLMLEIRCQIRATLKNECFGVKRAVSIHNSHSCWWRLLVASLLTEIRHLFRCLNLGLGASL